MEMILRGWKTWIQIAYSTFSPFHNYLRYLVLLPDYRAIDSKYTYFYLLFQFLEKYRGKFYLFSAGCPPNFIEWEISHNVLGDSHCIIEVKDGVPQPTRHKDCLSWVLNKLSNLQFLCGVFLSYFWQNFNKVINGFVLIVLIPKLPSFNNRFWDCLTKYDPSFVSNNWSIPGWC
jgi:hypothetical protein